MSQLFIRSTSKRTFTLLSKVWSGKQGAKPVQSEEHIKSTLQTKFPKAKEIEVCDVSGGCGAMFEVSVHAEEFKGLSTVKQHRLITDALKDHIKDMHGIRIHTSVPQNEN